MSYTTNNYYNRTPNIQVIVEDVVTWFFLKHSVYLGKCIDSTPNNNTSMHFEKKQAARLLLRVQCDALSQNDINLAKELFLVFMYATSKVS